MSKEELLELTGEVIEKLPNAMFRVKLENGVEILAHTAGKMRKFRIRVMVGDKVDIEMTPYFFSSQATRKNRPPRAKTEATVNTSKSKCTTPLAIVTTL